jgi:putative membrane protein
VLPAALRPGLAVGIAVFTGLVVYHGVGELAAALVHAGWGLLLVAAFHLLPLTLDAFGWRSLVDASARPRAGFFVRARWIGESVNGLLPVMQVGGNVVKARLLGTAGVPGPRAGASVVVDVTTLLVSQLVFTAAGILLLVERTGGAHVVRAVAVGALIMGLLAVAFVVAQRSRLFGRGARAVARLGRGIGEQLALDADALDAEVRALHARRRRLGASVGWHLAAWVAGTGEVWLALNFLGHPVDWPTALLLESLGQAIRAAAFAVPGALGIQESGFVVLGSALGLGPDTCLALSLAKRARELLLGVPGLVAWQTAGARGAIEQSPPIAGAVREASR